MKDVCPITLTNFNSSRQKYLMTRLYPYLGENHVHRITPVLWLQLGEIDNVRAVGRELVPEEEVDEVHLGDHVNKVQQLAAEVLDGVEAVGSPVEAEVLHDQGDLVLLGTIVNDGLHQPCKQQEQNKNIGKKWVIC